MPVYTFRCQECFEPFEKILRVSQYDTPQDCPSCNSPNTERTITEVNFVLKGDGWPGKNLKIKDQMQRRRREVGYKQEEFLRDGRAPRLVPNVEGERTESWADAKALARSKGKDTSGYDRMIQKEKILQSKVVKE